MKTYVMTFFMLLLSGPIIEAAPTHSCSKVILDQRGLGAVKDTDCTLTDARDFAMLWLLELRRGAFRSERALDQLEFLLSYAESSATSSRHLEKNTFTDKFFEAFSDELQKLAEGLKSETDAALKDLEKKSSPDAALGHKKRVEGMATRLKSILGQNNTLVAFLESKPDNESHATKLLTALASSSGSVSVEIDKATATRLSEAKVAAANLETEYAKASTREAMNEVDLKHRQPFRQKLKESVLFCRAASEDCTATIDELREKDALAYQQKLATTSTAVERGDVGIAPGLLYLIGWSSAAFKGKNNAKPYISSAYLNEYGGIQPRENLTRISRFFPSITGYYVCSDPFWLGISAGINEGKNNNGNGFAVALGASGGFKISKSAHFGLFFGMIHDPSIRTYAQWLDPTYGGVVLRTAVPNFADTFGQTFAGREIPTVGIAGQYTAIGVVFSVTL